jgi:O-antigen biosynthesis protein WbqP
MWNVLAGDMSLVGPRPCLPSQTDLVEARRQLGVFAVRPGITGLAQVNGIDMSDADRLAEIDASYVRTQSLMGDFRLIIATLRGQGVGVDQVVRHNT